MISSALKRQVWLIDIIMHSPKGLTFQEISERWLISSLNETHDKLSKRTFFSQIHSIFDNFGIHIECDHKSGYLYYVSSSDIEYGSVKKTVINSFILSNLVESRPDVAKRIQVCQSFGEVNLSPIIDGIMKNRCLKIHHYTDMTSLRESKPEFAHTQDVEYIYDVEPYGLYYRGVWFLIAKVKIDKRLHIYDVSRLIEIDELPESFRYPEEFDLNNFIAQYDSITAIESWTGILDDGCYFDQTYFEESNHNNT